MSSSLFIFIKVNVEEYTLKPRITQELAVVLYKSIVKYPERFDIF